MHTPHDRRSQHSEQSEAQAARYWKGHRDALLNHEIIVGISGKWTQREQCKGCGTLEANEDRS